MTTAPKQYWPQSLPGSMTFPRNTLYFNLEVSATRYPDKPAIVFYDSVLTYAELRQEVDSLAGYLQQVCRIQPGDRVVLYTQNSPQFVVAYYAILRAQAVVVPVNPMNLSDEVRYCVTNSGAKTALVGQELYPNVESLLASGDLEHVVVHTYSDYLTQETDLDLPESVVEPRIRLSGDGLCHWQDALGLAIPPAPYTGHCDDIALLAYTSGTTGHPKGVVHDHSSTIAPIAAYAEWFSLSSIHPVLSVAPLFHLLGMQGGMNAAIYSGQTAVLLQRWNSETAIRSIERHKVYSWGAAPSMIVDMFANPRLSQYDITSLKLLGGGGAAMPEAVSRRLEGEFNISYAEAYGLTESAAFILGNPVERGKRQCLGIATFDVDARLVDPATLEEVSQSETGELVLSGPQIMREYWRNPEATAQAFIEIEGKRFLRTGDLAYRDEEGYFFMVDRLKRMINASGFKVWPAEVESTMYGHPDIHEACVIGVPDAKRGETGRAIVVLKTTADASLTEDDLIAWCREHMAAYKVPSSVEIVDELPKSGTGKIMWRWLQEAAREKVS